MTLACARSNIRNTIKLIGHEPYLEKLMLQNIKSLKEAGQSLRNAGYEFHVLKVSLNFNKLEEILDGLALPMIVQLGHDYSCQYTIGIVPNRMVGQLDTDDISSAFSIVGVSHSDHELIPFSEENLALCSEGQKFINVKKECSLFFFPSKKFAKKTLKMTNQDFKTLYKSPDDILGFMKQFNKK